MLPDKKAVGQIPGPGVPMFFLRLLSTFFWFLPQSKNMNVRKLVNLFEAL